MANLQQKLLRSIIPCPVVSILRPCVRETAITLNDVIQHSSHATLAHPIESVC